MRTLSVFLVLALTLPSPSFALRESQEGRAILEIQRRLTSGLEESLEPAEEMELFYKAAEIMKDALEDDLSREEGRLFLKKLKNAMGVVQNTPDYKDNENLRKKVDTLDEGVSQTFLKTYAAQLRQSSRQSLQQIKDRDSLLRHLKSELETFYREWKERISALEQKYYLRLLAGADGIVKGIESRDSHFYRSQDNLITFLTHGDDLLVFSASPSEKTSLVVQEGIRSFNNTPSRVLVVRKDARGLLRSNPGKFFEQKDEKSPRRPFIRQISYNASDHVLTLVLDERMAGNGELSIPFKAQPIPRRHHPISQPATLRLTAVMPSSSHQPTAGLEEPNRQKRLQINNVKEALQALDGDGLPEKIAAAMWIRQALIPLRPEMVQNASSVVEKLVAAFIGVEDWRGSRLRNVISITLNQLSNYEIFHPSLRTQIPALQGSAGRWAFHEGEGQAAAKRINQLEKRLAATSPPANPSSVSSVSPAMRAYAAHELITVLWELAPQVKKDILIGIGPSVVDQHLAELNVLSNYFPPDIRAKIFVWTRNSEQGQQLGDFVNDVDPSGLAARIKEDLKIDASVAAVFFSHNDEELKALQASLREQGIPIVLERRDLSTELNGFLRQILASLTGAGLEEIEERFDIEEMAQDIRTLTEA